MEHLTLFHAYISRGYFVYYIESYFGSNGNKTIEIIYDVETQRVIKAITYDNDGVVDNYSTYEYIDNNQTRVRKLYSADGILKYTEYYDHATGELLKTEYPYS